MHGTRREQKSAFPLDQQILLIIRSLPRVLFTQRPSFINTICLKMRYTVKLVYKGISQDINALL